MRDTIFALATGAGRSAIAAVRVSGPDAGALLDRLCANRPRPRVASLRTVRAPGGEAIDQALVLWFPGPDSFTGEDVFELQLHGGPAIVDAALSALAALGARPAEPGAFTRRAFEAGRMDLSQAEAVADLVDAETEAQRRQALGQLGGAMSQQGAAWRETLLTALAFLEAQIDFPDEEVPPDLAVRARAPLTALAEEIEQALATARGERVRDGLKIVLIGAPNAGKSSLLNALLGRDAAIVSATPGTTRDVVEATMTIAGHKVLFADTAGIRLTHDPVEAEGVRRARAWAEEADLRLWLHDPADADADAGLQGDTDVLLQQGDYLVLTKSDVRDAAMRRAVSRDARFDKVIAASVVEPDGLSTLRAEIDCWVKDALDGVDAPLITQARHRLLLTEAQAHLRRGLSRKDDDAELRAEDVRLAARALERLTGRVNPEDVLDKVFSAFCIGK